MTQHQWDGEWLEYTDDDYDALGLPQGAPALVSTLSHIDAFDPANGIYAIATDGTEPVRMRQCIYNVSIMTSAQENGHCVSFMTKAAANACAADARNHGAYSAIVWTA